MAEISVIVPTYNSGQYLDRCIQSILSQSFTDFELIIIDDGSQDDSFIIAKRYARLDSRIVLVKQCNRGVSSARNHGLDLSTGRFVSFIDSDDYIYDDYLENLYSKLVSNVDLVFSGMEYFLEGRAVKRILQKDHCWNLDYEKDFIDFLYQPLQTSPCSKLYLCNIIKDNGIRFDTALFCAEDRDFNLKYFAHVNRAVSIPYSGYCYRRDVLGSLSKKPNPNAFKNRCIHWSMRYSLCNERFNISDRTIEILVNDLFFIANNEIISIAKHSSSYSNARTLCKQEMFYVDWHFLKEYKKFINAPKWQRMLLLQRGFSLLIILYKLYLHGKKKS